MPKVKANGVELYYEDNGPSDAPVILLIMGLGTQMIAWPPDFIQGLVKRGFRVIHFDNRDVGLSAHMDDAPMPSLVWTMLATRFGWPVKLGYTLSDLAEDAVGLLDALGIGKAHVVGASMGGMIAQLVAANHSDRVLSLTSVMSSSGARGLPGPAPEIRKRLMKGRPKNPTREEAIALGVETLKSISFPDSARAPDGFEVAAAAAFDRNYDPDGLRRQFLAIIADGSRVERLKVIRTPTLVIHGKADALVPYPCSEDIARHIPGARLELIDAMAHDLPPSQLGRMVDLIAGHAQASQLTT
ncbi:alpha/beta fold hydrolase [Sphingorhabdus sp.]|jgi:pimeloyl-ACP methyl ester carboxylesterase|uniref:alpha/beta fold hydrolase n=1 Tax=Sphingorhabdus sp. TaxID=1902408 RepID=UPI003BB0DF7F|nr:alpha/beta fold hydrolase [Sphingomonadales bacterium]MBK9433480.1 alpha/beta fold hydrolase [Sphingomonadales bacterium]MBL0020885.1 alpha/beta fold hydrolase [Sphingomonadales bacterium]